MNYRLLRISLLSMLVMLCGGLAHATDPVTAKWDFQNLIPATMADVNIQGTKEADIASDVDGIVMHVVSNSGKLQYNASGYAQFNTNTKVQIPVKNAGDVVTVVSFPGQSNYTVGGEDATGQNTFEYAAKASDVSKGYVEVIPTKTAYVYSFKVTQYAPKKAITLDNEPVVATFPFNLGTEGQTATFTNADYFLNSKVTLGTNLSIKDKNTLKDAETENNVDLTRIEPAEKLDTPDEASATRFTITPKPGFTFTPTKVSMNITRFGTDNGLTDIAWEVKGGENIVLAKEVKAARNNKNPNISKLTYEITDATAAEGPATLLLHLYNLQAGKQFGLSGIVIEGTLSGTEKELPILASFKINGIEYTVGDVFGDQFEATLKLSKKDNMVSAENPLTDVIATNGEIGTISYEGSETACKVTIPMTAGTVQQDYVLNVIQKPDYTLSYIGVDGTTVIDTQVREEDQPIGEFAVDIATVAATKDGYKARGWFKQNSVGEKYTTESIITENSKLYAVQTEIEVSSNSRKYEFALTDKNFYAEDHEAFSPQDGAKCKFHDNTHGWSAYNGDKIDLLVGPKATISITTCKYGSATNILVKKGEETLVTLDGKNADTDGTVVSYDYEGEATTLTLEMVATGEMYIHNVKIVNTAETSYDKDGDWLIVKAGDAHSLIDAIEAAHGTTDQPQYIFIPNGIYDLDTKALTTLGGSYVSLIGESMEGVIIKNRPVKEGIAITATLLNTGSNNYMQDLTLDCLAPYGTGDDTKSAERGVALQDKGSNTICKNVYLKGLQDTYYSNNSNGTYYFEDGKIEGTVDYVCGNGDVYFNKVLFYNATRSNGSGGDCIAAPNTLKSFGYIFSDCTIDGTEVNANNYRLARPWAASTIVKMINTKMIIKPVAEGWDEWSPAHAVTRFAEYNSVDAEGTAIDLSSRKTTIGGSENNPVLTADEAAACAVDQIFAGDWKPQVLATQLEAPAAAYANGNVTWTPANNGAIAYLIEKNGEFAGITTGNSFAISIDAEKDKLTIRAANPRGGFGKAKPVTGTTGINKVNADTNAKLTIYDLQGRRVEKATRGIYIVNGNTVVIK